MSTRHLQSHLSKPECLKPAPPPTHQVPLFYKDKHLLPVALLLLTPYFLSAANAGSFTFKYPVIWPLLVTSAIPTLVQATVFCPLDSAVVTNCNRCLFSSQQ